MNERDIKTPQIYEDRLGLYHSNLYITTQISKLYHYMYITCILHAFLVVCNICVISQACHNDNIDGCYHVFLMFF